MFLRFMLPPSSRSKWALWLRVYAHIGLSFSSPTIGEYGALSTVLANRSSVPWNMNLHTHEHSLTLHSSTRKMDAERISETSASLSTITRCTRTELTWTMNGSYRPKSVTFLFVLCLCCIGFSKILWNSWVAERLAASQEGVISLELVNIYYLCYTYFKIFQEF
jgi:hypothetical protein